MLLHLNLFRTAFSKRFTYLIAVLGLSLLATILPVSPITPVGVVQAQPGITATVDRTTLAFDEYLELTVTISGDVLDISGPDVSGLTDFKVIGSSVSTQVSMANGNLTAQGSYIYRLRPLREGDLIIPPFSVEVDGQIIQTEPIEIVVTAGSSPAVEPDAGVPSTEAPASLEGQNFFVDAEVDDLRPYLGQQIVYTFRLYQAANFLGQPDYQPPPFIDFWGQTTLSQPNYRTQAAGRDYLVTEIRTALFPANVGLVTIAPAKFVIPGGLFEPDIILDTEPITVDVRSWPDDAPPDFNGAVGQFQISARLTQTEGKVNEPLTLFIEIEGAGNIDVLSEPPLPAMPAWRAFDSKVSTTSEVREDVVYGTRTFERLIVPSQPGVQSLPPISFSYFDPQIGAYTTVQTDPIPVTVLPGDAEPPVAPITGSDQQPISVVGGDIRHIKPVPAALRSPGAVVLFNPLYWICWILPALVAGGLWIFQKQRLRILSDSAYARSLRARRVAQANLAEARRLTGRESYARTHRVLLGYLADKLNRPTVGLTTEALTNLLTEAQLTPALIERIRITLDQIEIGRFAPIEEVAAQTLVTETQTLIGELEKAFGEPR
jgi:hypothetical protein